MHFNSVIYIDQTKIAVILQLLIQLSIYSTFKIRIHPSFVYMLLWYQHRKTLMIIINNYPFLKLLLLTNYAHLKRGSVNLVGMVRPTIPPVVVDGSNPHLR